MDTISFSHADQQKQRIEKFIAEPDSTSGLVSLPKVIKAGESITIPDGRVVVHPNLEIDGTLNIENGGELFVPFGGTLVSSDLMHPVDTIDDLRNETGKYKYVYVTGYHTKDDGAFGSNMFVWDEDSTETDNGGTIIKCTAVDTGRYKLKYSGAVNVKWFGAKGDGVTDDTIAIQNALRIGGVIVGSGNYKTSETLILDSNTILENIKINSTATIVFSSAGSEVGYIPLTSDAANDAFSCTVSNVSSFVVDGWAFIKSNEYWSISGAVKMGEYVKIQNIVDNTLYFYDSVVGTYLTADSASISPVIHKENIEFNNVTINGEVLVDNQEAVRFSLCKDIRIKNLKSKDFDYAHINFIRCVNYVVDGGESSKTGVQEGLDYGVVHSRGCYNGKVINYTGNAMRHISTIGGSEGISRFITVDKCFGYSLTNAGVDAHSAVYEHSFTNNFLSFDDSLSTSIDGIISNGGNPTISNNTLVNCRRHGVLWQPVIKQTNAKITGIISNINAKSNKLGATTATILITGSKTSGETIIDGCIISNIVCSGFDDLVTIITETSEINNVVINSVSTIGTISTRGIFINASSNNVNNLNIHGCNLENISSKPIYLFGSATYGVRDIIISENILQGGTIGVHGIGVVGGKIANNLIKGYSSAKFLFDSNSNIAIDKGITKIQTGSPTYTLLTHDTDFIYNRDANATITLPDPTINEDMEIRMRTIKEYKVDSASSNVVPINDTVAGTSILPATSGAWAVLKSNGTNWVIIQKG